MGFERIQYYKEEARKLTRGYIEDFVTYRIKSIPTMNKESRDFFKGRESILISLKDEFLETHSLNSLALLLRETCDREKIYVRNNNKKIWPDEKGGEDIIDGERRIWRIRPNDSYNSLLFSYMIVSLENIIYNKYISVRKYLDVDEYLDTVEEWVMQTIRHFDPSKNASFKTLTTMMIGNAVVNLIHKNGGIQHEIKDENGNRQYTYEGGIRKVLKNMEYRPVTLSLDTIMDDKGHPLNHSLPTTDSNLLNNMTLLKEKYKKENDLISWSIVDWQTDDSELFQNPILIDMFKDKKNITFSNRSFKEAYEKILSSDLYKEFGFEKPKLKSLFEQIEQANIDEDLKQRRKNSAYNKAYQASMDTLKKDVVEYEIRVM